MISRQQEQYRSGPVSYHREQMKRRSRLGLFVGILLLAGAVAGVWIGGVFKTKPLVLKGAVVTSDADPRRQLPVADARIAIRLSSAVPPSDLSRLFSMQSAGAAALAESKSDNAGFFTLTLPRDIRRGRSVIFQLSHPAYQPLSVTDYVGDQLYVLHME